jgi:hypothetical protein
MARKSFVLFTSAVGIAAVAAGAYVARHRREAHSIGTVKAKPLANDWRHTDDSLTEEFANVVREESVGAY